jgi:hypothetical protein
MGFRRRRVVPALVLQLMGGLEGLAAMTERHTERASGGSLSPGEVALRKME